MACGTNAGATRHREKGEPVCPDCLQAAAQYRRELRHRHTTPPPLDRDGAMVSIDPDEPWARPEMGAWTEHAACKGAPSEWFFPTCDVIPREALALCGTCPVQPDCLEHAVRVGEEYGIWGGRSARAIARLRRATRRSIA